VESADVAVGDTVLQSSLAVDGWECEIGAGGRVPWCVGGAGDGREQVSRRTPAGLCEVLAERWCLERGDGHAPAVDGVEAGDAVAELGVAVIMYAPRAAAG
jgi:hypothetical protein